MKGILEIFKFTERLPITDDQYRQTVAKNATTILSTLFESAPAKFRDLKTMKILVIGAGFFPSFMPLVNVLSRIVPNLTELYFTLVEPLKSETDRFHDYFLKLNNSGIESQVTIKYSAQNTGIKEYLLSHHDMIFDVIYFEQPDLSPIGILLAKKGGENAKLVVSVRESIPYLKRIVKPDSIIVASSLFKHDLIQLNALINFSLLIKTHLAYLPGFFSDGAPYSSGLISVVDPKMLPKINPEERSAAIKRNDSYYFLVLFASFIIFLLTPSWAKVLSSFFIIALFSFHRYGMVSLFIKFALIVAQLGVLAGSIAVSNTFVPHQTITAKDPANTD